MLREVEPFVQPLGWAPGPTQVGPAGLALLVAASRRDERVDALHSARLANDVIVKCLADGMPGFIVTAIVSTHSPAHLKGLAVDVAARKASWAHGPKTAALAWSVLKSRWPRRCFIVVGEGNHLHIEMARFDVLAHDGRTQAGQDATITATKLENTDMSNFNQNDPSQLDTAIGDLIGDVLTEAGPAAIIAGDVQSISDVVLERLLNSEAGDAILGDYEVGDFDDELGDALDDAGAGAPGRKKKNSGLAKFGRSLGGLARNAAKNAPRIATALVKSGVAQNIIRPAIVRNVRNAIANPKPSQQVAIMQRIAQSMPRTALKAGSIPFITLSGEIKARTSPFFDGSLDAEAASLLWEDLSKQPILPSGRVPFTKLATFAAGDHVIDVDTAISSSAGGPFANGTAWKWALTSVRLSATRDTARTSAFNLSLRYSADHVIQIPLELTGEGRNASIVVISVAPPANNRLYYKSSTLTAAATTTGDAKITISGLSSGYTVEASDYTRESPELQLLMQQLQAAMR